MLSVVDAVWVLLSALTTVWVALTTLTNALELRICTEKKFVFKLQLGFACFREQNVKKLKKSFFVHSQRVIRLPPVEKIELI